MALGFVISKVSYEQRIEILNPFFFKVSPRICVSVSFFNKNALCLPFMDMIQLSQGFRAVRQRQFTFYHYAPWSSWYPVVQPQKYERVNSKWSYQMVLNSGPQDRWLSPLTTSLLLLMWISNVCDRNNFFSL